MAEINYTLKLNIPNTDQVLQESFTVPVDDDIEQYDIENIIMDHLAEWTEQNIESTFIITNHTLTNVEEQEPSEEEISQIENTRLYDGDFDDDIVDFFLNI